jgi:hypothetical protein
MKIKAYTLFTASHKKFLTDYLLPSFPYHENVELCIRYKPQRCSTANFETEGWRDTMRDKVECFIEGIEVCKDNEIFMFIDPDIQFFGDFYNDIVTEIQNKDAVFQDDVFGGVNTGFFAVKNNKNTRALFKTVLGNLNSFSQEQVLLNHLLQQYKLSTSISINWSFLSKKYWTYGHIASLPGDLNGFRGSWTPEAIDFNVPKDIIMHHANWTGGVENKIKLLDIVKSKVYGY